MTNLLDLPLDQFRGYLAEGNYPQARQDELMRAYRAQNSLAGYLDRYGEDAYKGRLGLLDDGNMKVSPYFPVAVPKGMSIWDGLKSGRFQTRFKDYASDALGGVLNALNNPRDSYQGTLPQADYDSAAMASASLPMVAGGVVAGRNIGATNANASKSAGLLAAGLPEPRKAGEAMDFEKDLFWGEKDGENFVYKKTPDLSNDLAEVVAKKLNNIDGIEADVGTSNVSASSYVNVNFGTVDADGDIEPFEEFKLRFSDHPDRYGANKTIRFDETADDIYEFDEYVETRINKENLQEMLKDGIGSVLSFGKSKAVEASKEGYLTDIELSKFLKDLEKPINANASAPVGLLAAQPSTEDELRQYLMQRGLLR